MAQFPVDREGTWSTAQEPEKLCRLLTRAQLGLLQGQSSQDVLGGFFESICRLLLLSQKNPGCFC